MRRSRVRGQPSAASISGGRGCRPFVARGGDAFVPFGDADQLIAGAESAATAAAFPSPPLVTQMGAGHVDQALF